MLSCWASSWQVKDIHRPTRIAPSPPASAAGASVNHKKMRSSDTVRSSNICLRAFASSPSSSTTWLSLRASCYFDTFRHKLPACLRAQQLRHAVSSYSLGCSKTQKRAQGAWAFALAGDAPTSLKPDQIIRPSFSSFTTKSRESIAHAAWAALR